MSDTQQEDREHAAVEWHAKWCQEHNERPDFIDAWLAGAAAERKRTLDWLTERALGRDQLGDDQGAKVIDHLIDLLAGER